MIRFRESGSGRGVRVVLAAAVAVAGCSRSFQSEAPVGVSVKDVATLDGVVVSSACTPTGPELCFNATDDNCNGVIDEGCGAGTGILQFMVAWGASSADIDVTLIDPKGNKIHKSNRSNAGFLFEKDCPAEGCHGQNVENIFFEGVEPTRGKYVVEIRLVDPNGADLPVHAHLSARVGNRTFGSDFTLATGSHDRKGFSFRL